MGMTKLRLEGYRKLIQDIQILRRELEEMRSSEVGLGSSVVLDYQKGYPRPQTVIGFDRERYDKKQKLLEKKEQQAAGVREWIDEIEDAETRAVFKYYYVDDLTWLQVAKKLGYRDNTDYPRLYIRDRYLKEMGIK